MEQSQDTAQPEKFSSDLKDYSGTVVDVGQGVHDFLWKRHPIHSFCVFVLPVCVSLLIACLEFRYGNINSEGDSGVMGAIAVVSLPLLIPTLSYWRVRSRMRRLFYTELATALGYTYTESGEVPASGRLFEFGDGHLMTNAFSGTYKNIPVRLADYSYDEGSGKSRHTYYFTIGELAVSGTLPQILCKPVHWTTDSILRSWKNPGEESLALEGNFNTKFTVYVPKGKEIEALQVLEPNVMEKLMEGFEDFGFECTGSRVYLFTKGTMAENRAAVLGMHALLERFCDVLLPELQSFTNTNPNEISASV